MKIGIIDSGKGGLAVLKRILSPEHEYVVVMDDAFFPYGNKSKEFLCKRSYYLVRFLRTKGVEKIIIACNTLSLLALDFLKANCDLPILGIFEYLKDHLHPQNILLGSYNTCCVVQQLYPWVPTLDGTPLIEAIQKGEKVDRMLEDYQKKYQNYSRLLLACTHFLYLEPSVFHINTIDPIESLKKDLA